MNAVNAPKLMNDVDVATSRKIAANPITPHNAMLKTGVWNRSDTQPNTRCGSTRSRPIAYSNRDTAAWAARPEVNWPTINPVRNTAPKRLPPIVFAISEASDSELAKVPPGDTSVTKYVTTMKIPPPINATSTIARGTLRSASCDSSVSVLFVILSITHLVSSSQSLVSTTPFTGGGGFSALAAGAAVAAYSFLGFDAISTLTEESYDAERNVPRAIVMVALIGGGIFIVVTYFVTLVSPGGTFANSESLASDIAKTIGGSLFGAVFLTGLIVGQFASGLAAQAAVSRLLYAMGRDRVLPQRAFGWVSERFHTPVFNIALCGVIGLAAIFLDVATSTSFINFGAFTAFTLVNLAVIAYYLRHRDEHLSPWRYILLPAIGAVIDIFLLTQLDSKALILGLSWLGIGIVYLLVLTRGLTKEPPEMTAIAEAE